MSGSTTTDETAAGAARTSTAPNQQDLQSTIAPQLTTASVNPEDQAEIPMQDEESPHIQQPYIDEDLTEEYILDVVMQDLDAANTIRSILDISTALSTSFIPTLITDTGVIKKYCSGLKLLQNENWIGHLINPAA